MLKPAIDELEVEAPGRREEIERAQRPDARPIAKLIIDGLEIAVPRGTKLIDAAERVGIIIPRFCYLKVLGSVGACRMCAVKMIQGPFKGVQMSCMIDAQDGMVVSTTDEEAVDFRRHVIEWLMLNHPHDCPVCDEGGQCLLQDMTVSGGHGMRRYLGNKRTYRDQYLGAFIAHEMNRCIHCYRCSRFYQEFAGYRDLGVMQIANRVFFGRHADGQLESPFSGNLVDICPTGVYTDIPARHRARRWDLKRGPSLCIHCSLGCNTIGNSRYREIVRIEGRLNRAVNGPFICDRGRFGFAYANHPERPRRARIGAVEASWDDAVRAAAAGLDRVSRESGPAAVACLGSVRSSLEAQSILKGLSRAATWGAPHYFIDPMIARKVKTAVSRLDARLAVSMSEIETADFVLVVGSDPVNEAPMLALAIRQAFRKGAAVVVIDPRPVSLPFDFEHLPVAPRDIDSCFEALVGKALQPAERGEPSKGKPKFDPEELTKYRLDSRVLDQVLNLAPRLDRSRNPVIVCGTDVVRQTTPALAANQALLLKRAKGRAGVFYVLPGANAFSGGLLSEAGDLSFLDTLEGIENGKIRALLAVESDPFFHLLDLKRLEQAVSKLDFLVVMDHVPSRFARCAHVFLPTSTMFEAPMSFVNQEGRLQRSEAVHSGGTPVAQDGAGDHPPRIYGRGVPGSDPKAAWKALADIGRALSLPEEELPGDDPLKHFAQDYPPFGRLQAMDFPPEGARILHGPDDITRSADAAAIPPRSDEPMELLLVDWTFGTEELSSYSDHIRKVEKEPVLFMHGADAAREGLSDGDVVLVSLQDEPWLRVKLNLADNMARGVLILPRHRRLEFLNQKSFSPPAPPGSMKVTIRRSVDQDALRGWILARSL